MTHKHPNPARTLSAGYRLTLCAALLGLLITPPASADDQLAAKVVAAYANTQTYSASLTYASRMTQGRQSRTEQTTVPIAFDREAQKLLLDRPNIKLVTDGADLFLQVDQIKAAYLKQPIPRRPMDYDVLGEALPALAEPAFPDLVMLLAADPFAILARGDDPQINEPGPDADGNPRLELVGPMGTMTLTLDPKTHLITRAVYTYDAQANNLPPDVSMEEHFVMGSVTHNQPLAEDAFAFNTAGRKAVASAEALALAARAAPQHPLVGRPAPDVAFTDAQGNKVTVADMAAKVVVLDFWAAWCPPCRQWMPQLDAVHNWAAEQGHDVAIYAVSINDDAEADRALFAEGGFAMGLLFAADGGAVGRAYGTARGFSIPTTAIIVDGTVVEVHVGVGPDTADQVKALIAEHGKAENPTEPAG